MTTHALGSPQGGMAPQLHHLGKRVTVQAKVLRFARQQKPLGGLMRLVAKITSSVVNRGMDVFGIADQLVVALQA